MRTTSIVITLAACIAGAGCGTPRPARSAGMPSPARDAEANRIALQAQRAQKDGEVDQAIELYRQAITTSDNLFGAWNNLGMLLLIKGQYIDAVEALKRAADLSPTDPRPLQNIGVAYSRAGWEQKAFDHYLQALQRDPRDVKSLRGSISSARMLGISDEAALDRVYVALMVDTDPDWRRVHERERSRIDGEIKARSRQAASP